MRYVNPLLQLVARGARQNTGMSTPARPPQDIDPNMAERLHQLRQALGLSVNDMAQRVGLWGANGADNLRQMERCARPIPGTLQVLMGYLERELQDKG